MRPRLYWSNRLVYCGDYVKYLIGAYEAKTKLPELLRRVEAGEAFTITNRGVPVAELRPAAAASLQAVAGMRAFKRVPGVSAADVREMIAQGRR